MVYGYDVPRHTSPNKKRNVKTTTRLRGEGSSLCSVVILRRSGHTWPLILAANRDEMIERAWDPPARHWPDRADVVAGRDRLCNGTWLGLNDHGVVAAVLNRVGSLGPAAGKRSRGELVLEALDHADAQSAAEQLRHLDPSGYRSFNLMVADGQAAFWLKSMGRAGGAIKVTKLPEGVSMLTARDLNDHTSPRIARNLPDFETALPPDPDLDDWEAWQELMRRSALDDPMDGMIVVTDSGFETVSSSLIALPSASHAIAGEEAKPVWLFSPGRPDQADYRPVTL